MKDRFGPSLCHIIPSAFQTLNLVESLEKCKYTSQFFGIGIFTEYLSFIGSKDTIILKISLSLKSSPAI